MGQYLLKGGKNLLELQVWVIEWEWSIDVLDLVALFLTSF